MSSVTHDVTAPPQVLLAHHLKSLKLPTFAREYEKVASECTRDQVDYPRYLLRLCELERIERDRRNMERRIRAAKFPQTKSLDTFDFKAIPSLNKALVLDATPESASLLPGYGCPSGHQSQGLRGS